MKKLLPLLLICLATLFMFSSCGDPSANNKIRIKFDTDGKATVDSINVVLGEIPEIPEAPEVEGYVFAGWFFDEELTNRYFFDYALEENTTLYAKFYDITLGEYTVISNVDQLVAIKDAPEAKYLLACDINCGGATFEPIATFSGEIEGNGYKIHNFNLNKTNGALAFILNNAGTVENLSFSDFTYNVNCNYDGTTYSALAFGYNSGTIKNCHVLDSEMKIQIGWHQFTASIGGIVGYNVGTMTKCTNNAKLTVIMLGGWPYYDLGGVVGTNGYNGTVSECLNTAEVNVESTSNPRGTQHCIIGGAIGSNWSAVDNSANTGSLNVKLTNNGTLYARVGGFIALEVGTGEGIKNCYVNCNITLDGNNSGEKYVGGFVGITAGKIYNCYSNINMTSVSAQQFVGLGGFTGYNVLESGKQALITKCFTAGNIEVGSAPIHRGYFAGINTGTLATCVYADTLTLNLKTTQVNPDSETGETMDVLTPIETNCTDGEAKAEGELLSVNYLEKTLYFDRMAWLLTEGNFPTLRFGR